MPTVPATTKATTTISVDAPSSSAVAASAIPGGADQAQRQDPVTEHVAPAAEHDADDDRERLHRRQHHAGLLVGQLPLVVQVEDDDPVTASWATR